MKFFSKRQSMSVIDKLSKKRIALFKNGVFETDDKSLIKKLKPYFKHEGAKVKAKVLSYWELKKKAKAKGIKTFGLKKKDLIKALEEVK